MKLEALQRAFFAQVAQVGEPDAALVDEVRAHGALTPKQRLDLYASMYFSRLLEALHGDFPLSARLLGDRFEAVVADYVRAHPSTHPSLNELGGRFPGFLSGHPERSEAESKGQNVRGPVGDLRPDLSDLAALEWARAEAVTLADAEPVTQDALAELGPEAFGNAVLLLTPSVRVLSFSHEVPALWSALEHDEPAPPPQRSPSHVVVWRAAGFEIFHAAISAEEAEALRKVQQGLPLGEVCEAFGALEDPAGAAFQAIGSWFGEGMVGAAFVP